MSIANRPYIGTWKMGAQKLVQHTPDALVYVNGDLALPGCQRCHSSIDLQKFVTEVSVDAGCDPGSGSASFSVAIPPHHRDSFIRDAKFILRPGLEVHIYMRGYFPVKGMYSNLAQASSSRVDSSKPVVTDHAITGIRYTIEGLLNRGEKVNDLNPSQIANLQKLTANLETIHQYMDGLGKKGVLPNYAGGLKVGSVDAFANPKGSSHVGSSQHFDGKAIDMIISYKDKNGKKINVDPTTTWSALAKLRSTGYIEKGGIGAYLKATPKVNTLPGTTNANGYDPTNSWTDVPHYDIRGSNLNWYWYSIKQPDGTNLSIKQGGEAPPEFDVRSKDMLDPKELGVVKSTDHNKVEPTVSKSSSAPASFDPSTFESMGLDGYDIENVLAYPYYHVFHGVVTQVSHSYSAGTHNASIQCVSMLHFWQYQQMSTNASAFGARAPNSGNKMSMVGNNFTGKHPYEIMYALHHDTAGAAAGVSWALAQKTNQTASSDLTGESLYSLNIKYWQKRFSLKDIKLRMHGVTGEMFNSVQAAFLASASSTELMSLVRGRFNGKKAVGDDILSQAVSVGLYNKRRLEALVQSRSRRPPGQNASSTKLEVNMAEMHAFVSDVSQWGQIQLFESTYESKLDVANKVCEATGFEFYQDVDGDFVFKPPMYNLDTSGSRVYRIEDIDIISINFEEKEPQVTYMVCKGSHFTNIKVGIDNEMGVQGQYIDYRLVSQYGWRPGNFESAYFTDSMSMFYAAVNRLDIMNAPTKSGSVTIPLRPELRPGYPVYIPYLDCFYYCNSFAHSFSVGAGCTTSLQLIGKRSKFYAPGYPDKRGIEAIDLSNTLLPEKPLEVLDLSGRPRLSGFPNVVMALDPNQIDPMFLIVGSDVDKITDPATLEYLMKQAVRMSIVDSWPDNSGERPGPYYIVRGGTDGQQGNWFYLKTPNSVPENEIEKKDPESRIAKGMKGAIKVMQEAGNLVAYQKKQAEKSAKALTKLERQAASVKKLQDAADAAAKQTGADEANTAASRDRDIKDAKARAGMEALTKSKENAILEQNDANNISENDHSNLAEFRR